MKNFLLFFAGLTLSFAAFADVMEDFDSLGGNKVLLERAKDLNPEANVEIVQDRIVNRHHRLELAPEFGSVVGGNTYLTTMRMGLNAYYHFNPRWSLGAKYTYFNNTLSKDGESLIEDTKRTGKALVPEMDYPKQEYMAVLAWYPFYGKVNMLDKGIAHFDVYGQIGAGQVEILSGPTETYLAGVGIGFWISQHLTSRLEMNLQKYKTQRLMGENDMNLTQLSFQIGYLL